MKTETNPDKTQRKLNLSPITPFGQTKVERYKWKPLGAAGEYAMIPKEDLFIDHAYQRARVSEIRLNLMASEWDWKLCGTLSVSIRDDKWWVVDGQQRKLAADKRSDIAAMPCLIFPNDSQMNEAGVFLGLNNNRQTVMGYDRFKAMVVAKDSIAMQVKETLDSTGHKVGSSASRSTVSCVMCLCKFCKRYPKLFAPVWKLIADCSAGAAITDKVVAGMFLAEVSANKQGTTLLEIPYRPAILNLGCQVLMSEIMRQILSQDHAGEKVYAMGIISAINKTRGIKKLKLTSDL